MLSRNGRNNHDGSFDWADALIDAGITAGLTLCFSGTAMIATGIIYTAAGQLTLAFAVLGEFLTFLAIKRKLRAKVNEREQEGEKGSQS